MINIVLFEPEKPLNVGSIMRTCMVTSSLLHIIGPLTFSLEDKVLKRAGLDYLKTLKYHYYNSYQEFLEKNNFPNIIYITRYAKTPYNQINFKDKNNNFLMFGKESSGIPLKILKENKQNCFRIPMVKGARSLNLSNSVAIVLYEGLRQLSFEGLATFETVKDKDYL